MDHLPGRVPSGNRTLRLFLFTLTTTTNLERPMIYTVTWTGFTGNKIVANFNVKLEALQYAEYTAENFFDDIVLINNITGERTVL